MIALFLWLLALPTLVLCLFFFPLLFVVQVVTAIVCGILADRYDREVERWIAGAILAPLLAVIFLLAAGPARPAMRLAHNPDYVEPDPPPDSGHVACPACAEPIRRAALKCRWCGEEVAKWRQSP